MENHTGNKDIDDSNHHGSHHKMMIKDFRRRFWISLIITIPVLLLSPMINRFIGLDNLFIFNGSYFILLAFSTAVFLYGGYPFQKGMISELGNKRPGMMTLIGFAISVSYFYSGAVVLGLKGRFFFWELATLIDVMLLGHWIEMKSVVKTRSVLENITKLLPDKVTKIDDSGNKSEISLDSLEKDDIVLVKPGNKIPIDGEVIEGKSGVNESLLTGESKPVKKSEGDSVIGGSINNDGILKIKVKKTGEESYVNRIVTMVNDTIKEKSKMQHFADKAAMWLTFIALGAGIITLIAWKIFAGEDFTFSLERSVTVMVITCPHALGLAIPLVVAVSTTIAAKQGLIIRNRTAFENAWRADTVVFDKTGTLTKGEFGIFAVVSNDDSLSKEEILNIAGSIESNSEHPLAKPIADNAKQIREIDNFENIPGRGVQAEIDDKKVKIVSPQYLKENDIEIDNNDIRQLFDSSSTIVFVLIDDLLKGAIALSDMIREESKDAIESLQQMGLKCKVITGDNQKVTHDVAKELGLDDFEAEVLPENKSDGVKRMQENGQQVIMVGDGVNDAPALAQSNFGIAIGAGTDLAIDSADAILVSNDPRDVSDAISFSKKTYKKMKQNLFWATGYNAIAIPLAAGVLFWAGIILSPAVGAVLMSLSTVIVAINARLLK
ncbi:MAG: copper-translocating P-type ATPase [Candidatus Zixiibacteriota bacterium]